MSELSGLIDVGDLSEILIVLGRLEDELPRLKKNATLAALLKLAREQAAEVARLGEQLVDTRGLFRANADRLVRLCMDCFGKN